MKNKGFTLIELLVVISIISLLSTIVLASLNTARDKAKDAVIFSTLKQFQLAMELYYNDEGFYPGQGDLTFNCGYAYIGFCLHNDFRDASALGEAVSPYFSLIPFNEMLAMDYGVAYIFDIDLFYPTPPLSCEGTVFENYVLFFYKYDTSGRLLNLPLPSASASFWADDYYCLGA
jgi:prepilin-type N-terminal cleavage/methylation domain-containing protein